MPVLNNDAPVRAYFDTNTGRWQVEIGGMWLPVDPQNQGFLSSLAQQGRVQILSGPPAAEAPPAPSPQIGRGPAVARAQTATAPPAPAASTGMSGANLAAAGPLIGAARRQQAASAPAAMTPPPGAPAAAAAPETDPQRILFQTLTEQGQIPAGMTYEQWQQQYGYANPSRWAGGVVGTGSSSMMAPPGAPQPPQLPPRMAAGGMAGMDKHKMPDGSMMADGAMDMGGGTMMGMSEGMTPPPGMGMGEPTAVVGEAEDQGANIGMELVIVPQDAGTYTITWTDTPVAADLEDGSIVVPIEETGPATKAIKEQFPKLVGEPLMRRGGMFLGKHSGREYGKGGRVRGGSAGMGMKRPPGMAAGGTVDLFELSKQWSGQTDRPVSAPPGAGTPSDPSRSGAPDWWRPRRVVSGVQGTYNPYIGMGAFTDPGNLSLLMQMNPELRKRYTQDLRDAGYLPGSEGYEAMLRAGAPGVRNGTIYAG